MEKYDENLAENKFLNCLKSEHKDIFEAAVITECIICVPKTDINNIEEITSDTALNHILCPVVVNNAEEFITKKGTDILLKDGCLWLKTNPDRGLNILFEETFYEGKLGKYKVVCIDNFISNLLNDEYCLQKDNMSVKLKHSNVLKNLRSVNDFTDYICQVTGDPTTIDRVDDYIADFLSFPLSTIDIPKVNSLKDKVCDVLRKSLEHVHNNTLKPLWENELTLLHISVESYVIYNLHKILFEASTSDMALKDEKLSRILHSVKDFDLSNFGIKITNLNWLLSAKYELAAVNNFKSPFGKLQCVKRAIESFEPGNILNSDELLPLLVFCIIKCNLSNWFANLSFMKNFNFSLVNNEYDFILSSLEASLVYIQSGEINKLTSNDMNNLCNSNLSPSSKVDNFNSKSQMMRNKQTKLLYDRIKKQDLEGVKQIIENKESQEITFNLSVKESQLCHPLCLCDSCSPIVSESIVQLEPYDIDSADENLMTPLHIAVSYGNAIAAEYFLSRGANPDFRNLDGMTPLLLSAYKGYQNVLLLLLHSGCDINCFDNEGNSALHLACIAGHDSCVKALVFFTESIGLPLGFDFKNKYGDTAMHLASHWGYSSIVKFLMSQPRIASSCLDIRNKRNQRPIDCAHDTTISALLRESIETLEDNYSKLILLDIDNKFENQNDASASNLKAEDGEKEKILRRILKAINVGDINLACFYLKIDDINSPPSVESASKKCHPLCQCSNCFNGNVASPSPTKGKPNVSLINMVGENYGVLHASVCAANVDMCRILLRNGADPNVVTKEKKYSSLHLAVSVQSSEIIKLLAMFNVNVNSRDSLGNTPLHLCCHRGWKEGVSLLIKIGAEVGINNRAELTAKEEAEKSGHVDIVKILVWKMSEQSQNVRPARVYI